MENATAIIEQLQRELELLQAQNRELDKLYRDEQVAHQVTKGKLEQLLKRLYGPKSERLNPGQPELFEDPPAAPSPTAVEELPASPPLRPKKKGHGRQRIPAHWPRRIVVHELPADERPCPCCGVERLVIGEEISEKLDVQPAQFSVVQHVRKKYGCLTCLKAKADNVQAVDETPNVIQLAPPAPHLIPKCLAEPGLLAAIITNKYMDHLPLARQESIFARQGLTLSRQTLCGWMAGCAAALTPLYTLMLTRVLQSQVVNCDETRLPVQAPGQLHQSRLWQYAGDRDHPFIVFDYRESKCRDGPEKILENYRGFLQADAANVFDEIYKSSRIVEVGCWAHARRHMYAARASEPVLATQGLARIGQLFEIERTLKTEIAKRGLVGEVADQYVLEVRRRESVPRLAALKEWLDQIEPTLLPKSLLATACGYLRRQWVALNRYTTVGYLSIDNNVAERAFCAIGVGRKNWLFTGSEKGGQTTAILFSFAQTCRRLGLDPWKYLKETFEKLPVTPAADLETLLPKPLA